VASIGEPRTYPFVALALPDGLPPLPNRLHRRPPAADAPHRDLRDERALPGLRLRGRVLGDHRLHGRDVDRARGVLPVQALALTSAGRPVVADGRTGEARTS